MILFVGQVERSVRERGAFQEVDYPAMFGGHAKWVAEINEAPRINEYVSRAFAMACAGRPGPVVLSCPRHARRAIFAIPHPAHRDIETSQALIKCWS